MAADSVYQIFAERARRQPAADFLCIDVDLSWDYSDFSSSADGVLTVQGIFTAPLAARSLPFT